MDNDNMIYAVCSHFAYTIYLLFEQISIYIGILRNGLIKFDIKSGSLG